VDPDPDSDLVAPDPDSDPDPQHWFQQMRRGEGGGMKSGRLGV
jgi:hypothetical protein